MRTLPDRISEVALPSGARVRVDENGYLVDPEQWTQEFADLVAEHEEITITELHAEIISFIRSYEAEHGVMPDVRFAMEFLARRNGLGKQEAKALLFELFPYGYVGQACKMAGMRQPRAWSTG